MARRTKATITRDSVFKPASGSPSGPELVPPPSRSVPVPAAESRQTGVWLSDDDFDWLDERCRDIRNAGWRGVTRSAVIRAVIHALRNRSLLFSRVANEEELVAAIEESLDLEPSLMR